MPKRLPDVLTHVSEADLYRALGRAWPDAKPASILVLLADWAEETGRGVDMHCYNVGNAKHVAGDGQSWTYFACDEVINGKTVWYYPDSPACCFVAFEDLDTAVRWYLADIEKKYAGAWPSVLAGDPAAFVQHLKAARYFTGDEATYERSVVSLFAEYKAKFIDHPSVADLGIPWMQWIQKALIAASFDPGAVDGLPGPKTTAAVKRFQRSRGLVADGIVGPKTEMVLRLVLPRS